MDTINAALVESFGEAPRYRSIAAPQPDPRLELVDVLAVGIHPVTRGLASGQHYASSGTLPLVPGIDGVVRRADGSLAYVGGPSGQTLAERILIDPRAAIPLPASADPATVAATMNPAMSSWIVLHARVPFTPGKSVLVLGATGAAGSMAVKAARHLGAGRVIAAGRNRERLGAILNGGADEVVELSADAAATAQALADAAAQVDIVLDYVWGEPSERAMRAILEARGDHTAARLGAHRRNGRAEHHPRRRAPAVERPARERQRLRFGRHAAGRPAGTRCGGRLRRPRDHAATGRAARRRSRVESHGCAGRTHRRHPLTSGVQVRQRREHPAVAAVVGREPELGEDVADVLAHRGLRHGDRLRDLVVAEALRHETQHLVLARGERADGVVNTATREQLRDHLGVHHSGATDHPAEGVHELADVAHTLLEQVADALGAAGEQATRVLVFD